MPGEDSDPSDQSIPSVQVRTVWDRIANWWDQTIGEGNEFQQLLIMPATDLLLEPRAGQRILDIACGNGNYSRMLARRGVRVTAVDFCQAFIDRARQRTKAGDGQIDYHVIDATDSRQLESLGVAQFDAAVCSMAMMDMPTIDPLLAALHDLIKPGGYFVFSLPHPCFNSSYSKLTAELVNEDGRVQQKYGVAITEYLRSSTDLSAGIINQPEPHYIFHRPFAAVFRSCFAAGFVVDGFEEPAYPPDTGGKNAFSWNKRPQIPPAVVIRCRRG